ncbi:hypothetical protein NL676_023337 [Syzygium grande]|nr:hypothetical protein NL676_023337 [Syzygium grande]
MERNHSDSTSHLQDNRRSPMYPLSVAAPEAVPIKFVYVNPPNPANNKEASSGFEVPIHKNNQVGMMPTMVEPAKQSSPEMAKTKAKSNSVETLVFESHQGRGLLTQKEVFPSNDLAVEVAIKTEPGASAVAVVEKAKPRTEMASPSKLAVGQTSGARKVEEKVKPKSEKVPTPKTSGGPRNAPRKDQSRGAKEKGEDINNRVSSYISRAKMRIRTMSFAGGTQGAGHKDSGTDHFGNYIQRAKMKIRTMSGIGGDNNAQSK